ncbi:MAG: HAD-IA family hydrolase [Prevotella sp.]|nr:HAD-IA family hydrolase [Prevotella sp.]
MTGNHNYQFSILNYKNKHGFEHFEPKAVLFDMDGVLVNSMPLHAIAWQKSMATFGLKMTAEDAYMTEGARGIDTIRIMVRRQQNREIDEQEAQRMYDEKARIFATMKKPRLMYGARSLLRELKKRGMQVAIVTGSGQRPLINRLLKDFGEFIDEEHLVTAYDVKRGKPHADPYLLGMKKCGTHPWETVVVENAPLGVKAGVAAKAFTIAVNTGPLPDSALLESGADILFSSLNRLLVEVRRVK